MAIMKPSTWFSKQAALEGIDVSLPPDVQNELMRQYSMMSGSGTSGGLITTTTGTGQMQNYAQQAAPKAAPPAQDNIVNIRVEKVTNGYTVTISGKTWVVGDGDDLASIITAALVDRKMT
jgi:hypothetical protein